MAPPARPRPAIGRIWISLGALVLLPFVLVSHRRPVGLDREIAVIGIGIARSP